ncbi:MAG: sigma-E factor negative regulatory protein RseA [Burkholderiales bacterium]|jgi:sigma-E factor negative regulatory protein RseA
MNTREMTREQISVFADGELADQQLDGVLAAMRKDGGCDDWELYHRIGDVLRSDDMDVSMSPDFSARMAARLEMEPTIIAPSASVPSTSVTGLAPARGSRKRWALPGMVAAAAVASVAFIATPQLMVAMQGASSNAAPAVASADSHAAVVSANAPEGVILRDPRMDEYLLAHQRFSPSVYSTAQYARSAIFATDSTK